MERYLLATLFFGIYLVTSPALSQPASAEPLVPLGMFELNEQQRQNLRQIRRDFHARHCDLSWRILEAQEDIREMYAREKREAAQVGTAFRNLATLQQQLIEARINAENRAEAVLTEEQRAKLRAWRAGRVPGVYDGTPWADPRYPSGDTSLWQYQQPQQYPYPPENRQPAMPPGQRWVPPRGESGAQ
jgi:hypothetical protein